MLRRMLVFIASVATVMSFSSSALAAGKVEKNTPPNQQVSVNEVLAQVEKDNNENKNKDKDNKDKDHENKDDEENEPKKVFVCKYVGKPGEDERLQTGQNPISVSINAIEGEVKVGAYFVDVQGRSYVLAYDEGQPEPNRDDCPQNGAPEVPTDGGRGAGEVVGTTNISTNTTQYSVTSPEQQVEAPVSGVNAGAGSIVGSALALVSSMGTLGYGITRFSKVRA